LARHGLPPPAEIPPPPPFGKGGSQGARNPDQNLADLQARSPPCHLGARLLRQLEGEVGAEAVLAYMDFVQDNAEAAVKRLLRRLRDGAFTLPLDGGGRIAVAIRIDPPTAAPSSTSPAPARSSRATSTRRPASRIPPCSTSSAP